MGGKTSRVNKGSMEQSKNKVIVFIVAMKEEAATVAETLGVSTEKQTR